MRLSFKNWADTFGILSFISISETPVYAVYNKASKLGIYDLLYRK